MTSTSTPESEQKKKKRRLQSLRPNSSAVLDLPSGVGKVEQKWARDWLKKQAEAGNLRPVEGFDEDPLETYLDILGLNGRKMRSTIKPSAGEKYRMAPPRVV